MSSSVKERRLRAPDTYVIIFFVVLAAALLTYLVPPGYFETETISYIDSAGNEQTREVLIAEWLSETHARASWTSSRLLVVIAEHHLRTDLYLPQVLALLGDRAFSVILEEDRELFARAMESHIAPET